MRGKKMADLQKKLNILSEIAAELNKKKVTWAVGASLLLYLKGIVTDFHDLDLIIVEEDVEAVQEVLLSFGTLQPCNPDAQYKTMHFLEFIADGVEIDVIAGFTIVSDGKEYYFPLEKDTVCDFSEINGVRIPLHSVSEWRYYYQLMGRHEKVNIIDGH